MLIIHYAVISKHTMSNNEMEDIKSHKTTIMLNVHLY